MFYYVGSCRLDVDWVVSMNDIIGFKSQDGRNEIVM